MHIHYINYKVIRKLGFNSAFLAKNKKKTRCFISSIFKNNLNKIFLLGKINRICLGHILLIVQFGRQVVAALKVPIYYILYNMAAQFCFFFLTFNYFIPKRTMRKSLKRLTPKLGGRTVCSRCTLYNTSPNKNVLKILTFFLFECLFCLSLGFLLFFFFFLCLLVIPECFLGTVFLVIFRRRSKRSGKYKS